MRELKIGKVIVHTSIGESGEPLNRAITIIEQLTGGRPTIRRAKQTIRTFGIRKNEPISCLITLRGRNADEFLGKALTAVGNFVPSRSFDQSGNFAFGIKEHIDMSGTRYDPNLGIIGMDVMVSVERPGYRVKRRRKARSKIGRRHTVLREDAIEFIRNRFGTEVGLRGE
jgi:large subunit ribosomal protein L5